MQSSSSALESAAEKRVMRRERFWREIEAITPWSTLVAQLEPFYPKGQGRGRPPIGMQRMLRMYVVQQCLGLSDEGIEDAIYDRRAIRGFIDIELAREAAPDASTLLKFRHLLEAHGPTQAIFTAINEHLATQGLMLREGTVADATMISAPSSTKKNRGTRDPEMHQTKKGKNWFVGMKAHFSADRDTGLVHALVGTAANVSDVTVGNDLLQGDETDVFADAGYQGAEKRPDADAAAWHVATRPSVRKQWKKQPRIGKLLDYIERVKAAVRAKVEHPFHIVKNRFGLKKVRYGGLTKNKAQLFTLFGLANLLIAKRRLFAPHAQGAS